MTIWSKGLSLITHMAQFLSRVGMKVRPKNTSCGELQYQTMAFRLQLLGVLVADLSSSMLRKNLKQCNTVPKPVPSKQLGVGPGGEEGQAVGQQNIGESI